ncbi:hypothetical protein S40288_07888 [Stachybotrys chartarum IBT 40288]|nr:hypothetical protein S40288_07888 [Stachybotrys chartarum IBT 40288]
MPAPPAEPAIPRTDEVEAGPCGQNVEPQTPLTPVSVEGFISLQNLIIQRDAHALDETSKKDLARHLQICTKAFQKSSAKTILQEDRIQFLTTINNEAKNRRSVKSLVLGKAKVMSYEDLEDARAKRVGKEFTEAAKGKGKRGRKSKSSLPEPEEGIAETARRGRKRKSAELEVPEPTNKMARLSNAPKPASALVMQPGTQVAEEIEPRPWRAPVAPM